uniref:ATP synthase epsilon chain, chloroplastic n=1 Tax=Schizaea pectinata TaxID=148576 RepID=A0A286QHL2_9MONI|nr:ATP synthase CF1 subunit epsilon [Schizaea pectinata]APT66094.1 ATP synthase CF1 subunit epsilon [Schizaea pectinata]
MVLKLRVMAPNRTVWNSEVREIVLPTSSGQIGVLPNHAPLLTASDIGVPRMRHDEQWSTMALMGGFAMIDNNQVMILVNEAEQANEIDPEEAHKTFQMARADLAKAEGKKQIIEAGSSFRRAKARLEALEIA